MTLSERAKLATAVRQHKAAVRAEYVRALVSDGTPIKVAAWYAGVSRRTANRYRAGAR